MHKERVSVRQLALDTTSKIESSELSEVRSLLAFLRARAMLILENKEQDATETSVEKICRNTIWACLLNELQGIVATKDSINVDAWLAAGHKYFEQAAKEVRSEMMKSWRKLRRTKKGDLLFQAIELIPALDFRNRQVFVDIASQGALGFMDQLDFGASSGSKTFEVEMARNAEGLNKIAEDKEEFLRLYDQSFRYVFILALAPIESHSSNTNQKAIGAYYKDGDKLRNRLLDDREWVNVHLYPQHSRDPRTGCPAAVSFEGMSLVRWGFDEYRRFLAAMPASTYRSTSEYEASLNIVHELARQAQQD